MPNENPKPKWWLLYAILPLALVLLVVESQLALPSWAHQVVQILIVLFVTGLMGLWLVMNADAVTLEDASDEWPDATREAQIREQVSFAIQAWQAEQSEPSATRFDAMHPSHRFRVDPRRLTRRR